MKNKHILVLFLLLPLCLFGAERVEVSTNGCYSAPCLQRYLDEMGMDTEVAECNYSSYPGLVKPSGRLAKLKAKITLFSRKKWTPDPTLKRVVFMNIPKGLKLSNLPREKAVLFMFEPPLRLRKMYKQKVQKAFTRIYTFDDDLVDNKKYFKLYYSDLRPMIEDVVPFDKKELCTMVVGYTSDKSKHPEELYSERKKTIRFFEERGERGFTFYGRNWDPTKYPSYNGPIAGGPQEKIAVMKNFRFAICYENCNNIRGYITEKIFDCFAAGVVPIYWGAPNITDYIPAGCFIDRRSFPDHDALYTYLKTMPQEEYDTYIDTIRTFLHSEKAQLFTIDHFKETLKEALSDS